MLLHQELCQDPCTFDCILVLFLSRCMLCPDLLQLTLIADSTIATSPLWTVQPPLPTALTLFGMWYELRHVNQEFLPVPLCMLGSHSTWLFGRGGGAPLHFSLGPLAHQGRSQLKDQFKSVLKQRHVTQANDNGILSDMQRVFIAVLGLCSGEGRIPSKSRIRPLAV